MIDYDQLKTAKEFGVHPSQFEEKKSKPIILADGEPLLEMPAIASNEPIGDFEAEVEEPEPIPDVLPEGHKLIEETEGVNFKIIITQNGTGEYHGLIRFTNKNAVRLVSDSLAHLRLSLRNFSTQ